MIRKKLLTLAIVCVAMLIPVSALAGPATDVVRTKQAKLFELVAKPKSDAQQKQLRQMFDEMLAYDVFCKKSLGKEWDSLSGDQQTKFCDLLTKLVRNNYKRNLKKMLDYEINYVGEKEKNGGTYVLTRAKHKKDSKEPNIEIDFKLKKHGAWKVEDIVTERASLVKTYRSQFLRILRKKGYDALIEKMEKKLAKQD